MTINPNRPPGWPDPGLIRECKPAPSPPAPLVDELHPTPTRRELQTVAAIVDELLDSLLSRRWVGHSMPERRREAQRLLQLQQRLRETGLVKQQDETTGDLQ